MSAAPQILPSDYPRLDLAACFTSRPAMPEQILPGLIRGSVGALFAPGATGKSTLALQLATYRAGGRDFLGFGPCKPGRVIVFAAEDPPAILGARLHDMAKLLSTGEREQVIENLHIVPVGSRTPRDFLDGGRTADAIMRAAEGFDFAVLDTISRFHTGKENSREDAARVMRQLERIGEVGPAVAFLGHVNKAAALNDQGDQQQAARGSTVWVDEARWVAFLATCSSDEAKKYGIDEEFRRNFVRYGLSKANYVSPQPDIWLRRDTGGVLVREEMRRKGKPKTKQQSAAGVAGKGATDDWE